MSGDLFGNSRQDNAQAKGTGSTPWQPTNRQGSSLKFSQQDLPLEVTLLTDSKGKTGKCWLIKHKDGFALADAPDQQQARYKFHMADRTQNYVLGRAQLG